MHQKYVKNQPLKSPARVVIKKKTTKHLKAALDILEAALLIHVTLGRQHLEPETARFLLGSLLQTQELLPLLRPAPGSRSSGWKRD